MKKSINSIVFLSFVALTMAFSVPVMAQTNGDDDSASSVPASSIGASGTTGSASNGTDDGVTNNSSTVGTSGTAGNTSNGNDDSQSSTPSNPGNPSNPGSGSNSLSTSGNGRSSASSTASTSANTSVSATSSCPLLTDFLKIGGANSGVQVTKLQAFLKNSEGLTVDVNGIFDQKTFDAVSAFQKKYLSQVMGPWGATRASGFVYITTVKKINELACAKPLTLSAAELAIIESYKRGNNTGSSVSNSNGIGSNTNATGTLQVGTTDSENSIVAAVGEASILGRFWLFIKGMFR